LPYKHVVNVKQQERVQVEQSYDCPRMVTNLECKPRLTNCMDFGRGVLECDSRNTCEQDTRQVGTTTCTRLVDAWQTVTRSSMVTDTERVPAVEKTTTLEIVLVGEATVGGVRYRTKISVAPSLWAEAYQSEHSESKSFGPLPKAALEKTASEQLEVSVQAMMQRAILARHAELLEAKLASDGLNDAERREILIAIAFYRNTPSKELLTQTARVTDLRVSTLEHAFADPGIVLPAMDEPDPGDWFTLPEPDADAVAEIYTEESRSLLTKNFGGLSIMAHIGGGAQSAIDVPNYASMNLTMRFDYTPQALLIRNLSGSLWAQPVLASTIGGDGFVRYGLSAGPSVSLKLWQFSLRAEGHVGFDGRETYSKNSRPEFTVPFSGFGGYGAALAWTGPEMSFLGLTVAAARNHRAEHTYPMSNTLDVLVGRSLQIGGHYEVWGDVFQDTHRNAPSALWFSLGAAFDLTTTGEDDGAAAGEHVTTE
jgi:hypothetical protein